LIDGLQTRTATLESDMQSVGLVESLVYPGKIYGVVGQQTNIYYENAIQYGTMDTIAKCDIGGSLTGAERFRDRLIWTPTASGNTAETISMWKANTKNVALSANVSFISAPADAGSGEIKVLVIGDSKVAYGQPTGYMKQLFANDSLTLTLLGSRYGNNNTGDETNRHEGRGGWAAYDYCNRATRGSVVNPFSNETETDGSHFDFSMYMTNQGCTGVDYVIINLGTNDFRTTAYVYRLCISQMVDSIHRYNSNVKIILGLFEGVYKPKLEWASRNEAYMTYRKALIDFYGGKESENIWLNPMYLSMSLYDDFQKTTVPLSYADEFVQDGKTREYCSDGIHQNNAGFYKNAVSMYAILKCIEAEMI
jgi:lysophospholipase L1-like esterase